MTKRRSKKVIRYHRPLNINMGTIIFFIILICLVFSVYTYLKREKIQFCEVVDGDIVNNRIYNGLALREGQMRTAGRSGYINYYLREGRCASMGSRIYFLGETGNLEALLKENAGEGTSLSDGSLSNLRKQLVSSVLSFQNQDFGTIYGARTSLDASVVEYSGFSTLDRLDKLVEQPGAVFEQVRSDVSGAVSYGIDSFESMTTSDMDAADFDRSTYVKTIHKSGDLTGSGPPAYKIATSGEWSIMFLLGSEDATLYNNETALCVVFRGYSLSTLATYSTFTGKDGATYGELDFSKYMEQFVSDRFVGFEIKVDKTDGLKIPINAVTDKNFYLVPLEYITQGGDSPEDGFYKEVCAENDISTVLVPTTVYYSDDEFYYVDVGKKNGLKAGDYVVRLESSGRCQIGRTTSLKGAYNTNKSYTIFKQIDMLGSNNEYYTVCKNVKYGLSVYDHTILDASMVEERQLLYQ